MNIKAWLQGLSAVQTSMNELKNISLAFSETGALSASTLNAMSMSVSGLSKEQALLALSYKNLSDAEKEQILITAGIISTNESISASSAEIIIAESALSAEKKELLKTKIEELAVDGIVTKAKIDEAVATGVLAEADAIAMVRALRLTGANTAEAASFGLVAKAAWSATAALLSNPITWIVAGVAGLVFSLKQLTKAEEEVAEKAQQLGDSYKTTKSEIDDYKSKIDDLYKTINDSSSSYEETVQARQELLSIQDELIGKFGDEKKTIESVTEAIQGQSDALNDLAYNEWQKTKNEFNKSSFWNDVINTSEGFDNNIERMKSEMENAREILSFSQTDFIGKNGDFTQLKNEIEKLGYKYDQALGGYVKTGSVQEIYDDILSLQNLTKNINAPKKFLKDLTKDANEANETISKYGEMWDQYVLNDLILHNEDNKELANSFKEVTDAYNDYKEAFSSGKDTDDAISNFSEKIHNVIDDANVDDSVKEYFRNMYPSLMAETEKWEFKTKILPEFDTSKLKDNTKLDLLTAFTTSDAQKEEINKIIEEGSEVYNSYMEEISRATELGLIDNNYNFGDKLAEVQIGNINTANRKVLEWTKENVQKYHDELASYYVDNGDYANVEDFVNDYLGSYSTVDSQSRNFEGIEIAFTPMLVTDNGVEYIGSDTMNKYIHELINKANKQGLDWKKDSSVLLNLDKSGLELDGKTISNMLFGQGLNGDEEISHIVGKLGSVADETKYVKECAEEAGISVEKWLSLFNSSSVDDDTFNSILESAEEYGIVVGEDSEKIEQLLNLLTEWGVLQENINEEAQKFTEISVEEAKSSVSNLSEEYEVLKEILADTANVSQESYEKLLSHSAKYSAAIKTENGRITLNTTKLKAVAKSRNIDTKETIKETLALKKQEWVQWRNNLNVFDNELLDSITEKYDDIDALQSQITQYELLMGTLDECSSAFERFKNAQQTNDQEMYDTTNAAFKAIDDVLNPESDNYLKFNTDDVQEALQLTMNPKDFRKLLNTDNVEEYQKIVTEFRDNILKPLNDEKNVNSAKNLFDLIQKEIDSGDIPKTDEEWANRLGISTDYFHALSQFGNQYGFDSFEYSQFNTLDDYYEKLSNVKDAEEALALETDETSNAYMMQRKEMRDAQKELAQFVNETTNSVEDAYNKWNKDPHTQSGSFMDYLVGNTDFEEDDITGIAEIVQNQMEEVAELRDRTNEFYNKDLFDDYTKQYEELGGVLQALGYDYQTLEQRADDANKKIGSGKETISALTADQMTKKSYSSELSQYKQLMANRSKLSQQLKGLDIGSEEFAKVSSEIKEVNAELDGLREDVKIQIELDTSDIDSKITEVESRLATIKQQAEANKGTGALSQADMHHLNETAHILNQQKSQLQSQKSELEQTLKIVTDTSEVDSALSEIDSFTINDKEFSVKAKDQASPILTKLQNQLDTLKDKTIAVNVRANTGGINTSTDPRYTAANGTFNAFAGGSDIAIPHNEKALVNELGEEGLVRDGKLIPIKGGAQLINLRRGDIIFNHKQMEDLKKHGYTAGRGKIIGDAFFNGTVNAYANPQKVKVNVPTLNGVNNDIKKQTSKAAKDVSDSVKDAEEDVKENTEELFDWIERRVKKLQSQFDRILKQAQTTITKTLIGSYFNQVTKTTKEQLSTYSKAYTRYLEEANRVGLSKDYISKIRDGLIDLEKISDEDLKEKINTYQEMYDKATDSMDSYIETAEKLYNLPLDQAAEKVELFNDAIDLLEKKVENAIGSIAKNALIDQETRNQKDIVSAYTTANKTAKSNVKTTTSSLKKALNSSKKRKNSGVSTSEYKNIQKAIKAGQEVNVNMFTLNSAAYQEAIKYNEAIKAQAKATNELANAQEEYTSWLREAAKTKFDNVADDYEKKLKMLEYQTQHIDNQIAELEASGRRISRSYYLQEKTIANNRLKDLQAEQKALETQINTIPKGTDEWYDAYDAIEQVKNEISDVTQNIYSLNTALNELHIGIFNDIADQIRRITTEQEFLQGLFSHENMTDDKIGDFTTAGIAKLGSLVSEYYAFRDIAEKDRKELDELLYMQENGMKTYGEYTFNSTEELIKRIQEVYETLQNDIKDTYNIESELADMMKDKYQAELDLLKDLIDKKKDALQKEKDLYEYQKQISEKNKNITSLQQQIAAYSGNTSQEGLAQLQKLQAKLNDAQEDLRDAEYDKYISDQEDMLDKLYEEYEELITKKLEDFMTLVQEGIATASSERSEINTYLKKIASDNNYIIEFNDIFNNIKSIEDSVKSIASGIEKSITSSGETANLQSLTGNLAFPQTNLQKNTTSSTVKSAQEKRLSGILTSNGMVTDSSVEKYIKKYASKTNKKKSSFNAVNQLIYDYTNGKVLSDKELSTLAKKLEFPEKYTKNSKIYKTLKLMGFAKGGIVGSLNEAIKENGDDGIATVKVGEAILTPVQTDMFSKFVDNLPTLNEIPNIASNIAKLPQLDSINNVNNIDYGGVDFNISVYNPADANAIVSEIKNSQKLQKAIQAVSVDRLNGGGRLGVNSIKS